MTDIIGMDYSQALISRLETSLNNRGILVTSKEPADTGTTINVIGMGNKYIASVLVAKLDEEPSESDANSLIHDYISAVEAGLRERKTQTQPNT